MTYHSVFACCHYCEFPYNKVVWNKSTHSSRNCVKKRCLWSMDLLSLCQVVFFFFLPNCTTEAPGRVLIDFSSVLIGRCSAMQPLIGWHFGRGRGLGALRQVCRGETWEAVRKQSGRRWRRARRVVGAAGWRKVWWMEDARPNTERVQWVSLSAPGSSQPPRRFSPFNSHLPVWRPCAATSR